MSREKIVNSIGWIGAACLALCALPQAVIFWQSELFMGLDLIFLLFWYAGEWFMLVYSAIVCPKLPLVVNYLFNIICITVILFYKLYPGVSH